MKDYSVILPCGEATMIVIHDAFDKGYQQGYEDGQKEKLANAMIHDHEVAEKKAYEDGMNAAWEAAKKIHDGQIPYDVFGLDKTGNGFTYASPLNWGEAITAQEAIAKIKAYEDKQKQDAEIKVGYEVYNLDRENKRIVTAIDGNKAIQLCSNGKYTIDNIDTLHWTGREDLRIKKVLEKITSDKMGEVDG